jgi:8-oxo-dGTP pyrophosphatase MutT (NUDIX family)
MAAMEMSCFLRWPTGETVVENHIQPENRPDRKAFAKVNGERRLPRAVFNVMGLGDAVMLPVEPQFSAGGVAFRRTPQGAVEVALIAVGEKLRWQLPKGTIERDEPPEAAALREVREEAGVETEIVEPIDEVEYWYVGDSRGRRVRFHKKVYFYLMRYLAGDVADHDHEVREARWFPIDEAIERLAFKNEQEVAMAARECIARLTE